MVSINSASFFLLIADAMMAFPGNNWSIFLNLIFLEHVPVISIPEHSHGAALLVTA
jgi:hypothetical protein